MLTVACSNGVCLFIQESCKQLSYNFWCRFEFRFSKEFSKQGRLMFWWDTTEYVYKGRAEGNNFFISYYYAFFSGSNGGFQRDKKKKILTPSSCTFLSMQEMRLQAKCFWDQIQLMWHSWIETLLTLLYGNLFCTELSQQSTGHINKIWSQKLFRPRPISLC